MNFEKMVKQINGDSTLFPGEKVLIGLDRQCEVMLKSACLLTAEGACRELAWETCTGNSEERDGARILEPEGGDVLVAFHETRPNSRTHRTNGIRVDHEETAARCVVFFNAGTEERLTVEGAWLEPGHYMAVEERSMDDPEVREAFRRFENSPDTQADLEELRQRFEEKRREAGEKKQGEGDPAC